MKSNNEVTAVKMFSTVATLVALVIGGLIGVVSYANEYTDKALESAGQINSARIASIEESMVEIKDDVKDNAIAQREIVKNVQDMAIKTERVLTILQQQSRGN